jgi:hypothetical protein
MSDGMIVKLEGFVKMEKILRLNGSSRFCAFIGRCGGRSGVERGADDHRFTVKYKAA